MRQSTAISCSGLGDDTVMEGNDVLSLKKRLPSSSMSSRDLVDKVDTRPQKLFLLRTRVMVIENHREHQKEQKYFTKLKNQEAKCCHQSSVLSPSMMELKGSAFRL